MNEAIVSLGSNLGDRFLNIKKAIDKFTNFFMITERKLIDDPTVKTCSIITRKTVGESDDCVLGLYEFNDMGTSIDSTNYTNLYTSNSLYNAPNVGYCNTYSLYQ